ncbi:MAG: 3-deoxy-manno-octulosonate cytidylyltransferase [Phycisphaeraceae bacterium]|nr:3-deoxy-manno-octulosonate cytidylyltransferase [Phycisphaeraceae bacterium]
MTATGERAVAIVPARMASTRFPGKVLAAQTGRPLVQHVVERARLAGSVSRVVVAADDARIRDALVPLGTEVVMTRPDHPNGTSRLAEAASRLSLAADTLIVNAQGDEPEIEPSIIDQTVAALVRAPGAVIGTAAVPFATGEDTGDPTAVKVVCDLRGHAMYFSRSPIPMDRDRRGGPDATALRHIGLYVYRKSFLDIYGTLAETPLERCESLEQLRVLQHGYAIQVAICEGAATRRGIDTPEQYAEFVARWRSSRS